MNHLIVFVPWHSVVSWRRFPGPQNYDWVVTFRFGKGGVVANEPVTVETETIHLRKEELDAWRTGGVQGLVKMGAWWMRLESFEDMEGRSGKT